MDDLDLFCITCGSPGHLPSDCQAFHQNRPKAQQPQQLPARLDIARVPPPQKSTSITPTAKRESRSCKSPSTESVKASLAQAGQTKVSASASAPAPSPAPAPADSVKSTQQPTPRSSSSSSSNSLKKENSTQLSSKPKEVTSTPVAAAKRIERDPICVFCGRYQHHQATCPERMCFNCLSRMHPTSGCSEPPSSKRVRFPVSIITVDCNPQRLVTYFNQSIGVVNSVEFIPNKEWVIEFSRTCEARSASAISTSTILEAVGAVAAAEDNKHSERFRKKKKKRSQDQQG